MNGSERIKEYIDGGINNVFDILHNLIHDYNQCTYDVISPNFSLTNPRPCMTPFTRVWFNVEYNV